VFIAVTAAWRTCLEQFHANPKAFSRDDAVFGVALGMLGKG
jgi:hypothetical protein